jgi:hypothetical protein
MAQPIMVVTSVATVSTRKDANGLRVRERTVVYEGSAGPRELLETIVIQASAAVKGLESQAPQEPESVEMTEDQKRVLENDRGKSKAEEPWPSQENRQLLDFCRRIHATAGKIDKFLRETKGEAFIKRLHDSLPKLSAGASADIKLDANADEKKARQSYEAWAIQARCVHSKEDRSLLANSASVNSFEYCDLSIPPANNEAFDADKTPDYKFYYNNEAKLLTISENPKRSLAIAKEVCYSNIFSNLSGLLSVHIHSCPC